jgi:hypothetical protein
MPNLHLLTQTFSQARHASGTDQFNGLGPPLTLNQHEREKQALFDAGCANGWFRISAVAAPSFALFNSTRRR